MSDEQTPAEARHLPPLLITVSQGGLIWHDV
jgi:hypothetical protein